MKNNKTKVRLQNNEIVFGCALQQYRSSEIPRVFAAAGFDYMFIDAEHGGFGLETIQDMVSAANNAGITPFVRIGELLYSLVTRALDIGAQGIIFPRVEDPKKLEEAISWTKYPPDGVRGFGFMAPQLNYKPIPLPEIIEKLNYNTMNIVQFETLSSIENCDELLSVKGIDVAMIGPVDLSISLDVPGEFEHPKMLEAAERLVAACEKYNVVPGIHCRTPQDAIPWVKRGMRFIGGGSEHGMLLEKAKESMFELREVLEETKNTDQVQTEKYMLAAQEEE